jgi:hypothetical protein
MSKAFFALGGMFGGWQARKGAAKFPSASVNKSQMGV